MHADVIDRIYECSVVPELWPDVLDELARVSDARGGLLFSARKTLNWTSSSNLNDIFAAYVNDGWFTHCSRRVCLMSQTAPSFFVEHDFWSEHELDTNPIYRDFFRPRGLGWSAGTGLQMPTGDHIVFSIERDFNRGPIGKDHVARLNELRPHLARSAFVTARLGLQRAQGASEALAALGLPSLLLDRSGRVIEASSLIDTLGEHVSSGAHDKIVLADPRAQAQLVSALSTLSTNQSSSASSFPIRDMDDRPVMVAHLMPVRRSAHDIFTDSFALLILVPLGGPRAPSEALLRSMFDLTVAEARVAGGLVAGNTLEDIAADGEVAITTVRSQLRRVLEKTGCSRQAEVVALLASAALGSAEI